MSDADKRKEYKSRLEAVYEKYYTDCGRCKHYSECIRDVENPYNKFLSDTARLGEEYGVDPELPKVVFIGLEGLNNHITGESRIIGKITYPSVDKYNPHYKGVRYVLAYLLCKSGNMAPPESPLKSDLEKYSDTLKKYALLNCYKCAFANRSVNLPHTDAMKSNCQKILFEEIKALEPGFIVIQLKGDRPTDFEENLAKELSDEQIEICGNKKTGAYLLKGADKKPIIIIYTYHGSGSPLKEEKSWTIGKNHTYRYIDEYLNPVLDRAVEVYKENL